MQTRCRPSKELYDTCRAGRHVSQSTTSTRSTTPASSLFWSLGLGHKKSSQGGGGKPKCIPVVQIANKLVFCLSKEFCTTHATRGMLLLVLPSAHNGRADNTAFLLGLAANTGPSTAARVSVPIFCHHRRSNRSRLSKKLYATCGA